MSWWLVLLLGFVLLLIAVALVALVALRVFRKGRALLAELGEAADRLTAAAEGRSVPDPHPSSTRRTP